MPVAPDSRAARTGNFIRDGREGATTAEEVQKKNSSDKREVGKFRMSRGLYAGRRAGRQAQGVDRPRRHDRDAPLTRHTPGCCVRGQQTPQPEIFEISDAKSARSLPEESSGW